MIAEKEGMGPYSAIRKGDWKLIYFYGPRRAELYNLKNDIGEHHNLAKQYQHKAAALAQQLTEILKSEKAQFPVDQASGKKLYPYQ